MKFSLCSLLVLGAVLCTLSVSDAQLSNLPLISDLAGAGWTIENGNGSITVDAAVPVYALEALHNAKLVPDPLERCGTMPCFIGLTIIILPAVCDT